MDSVSKKRENEEALSCPFCFETYGGNHVPYVMHPCGHSLCKLCIGKVQACPICRAQIEKTSRCYLAESLMDIIEPPAKKQCSLKKESASDIMKGLCTKLNNATPQETYALLCQINKMLDHDDTLYQSLFSCGGLESLLLIALQSDQPNTQFQACCVMHNATCDTTTASAQLVNVERFNELLLVMQTVTLQTTRTSLVSMIQNMLIDGGETMCDRLVGFGVISALCAMMETEKENTDALVLIVETLYVCMKPGLSVLPWKMVLQIAQTLAPWIDHAHVELRRMVFRTFERVSFPKVHKLNAAQLDVVPKIAAHMVDADETCRSCVIAFVSNLSVGEDSSCITTVIQAGVLGYVKAILSELNKYSTSNENMLWSILDKISAGTTEQLGALIDEGIIHVVMKTAQEHAKQNIRKTAYIVLSNAVLRCTAAQEAKLKKLHVDNMFRTIPGCCKTWNWAIGAACLKYT